MLENRMIKEDRVRPEFLNFQVVIQAVGKAGYCKKAFEIFALMRRMRIEPKKYTYTSLWNACANSTNSNVAIEHADWLLKKLERECFFLGRPHFHALIKVYGRHGKLKEAFKLVDRMMTLGFRPDAETYAHILQACISDEAAGFKLAIEVWRKMMIQRCAPELENFNLLLRACRDCDLGSPEFASKLLGHSQTNFNSIENRELLSTTKTIDRNVDNMKFLPGDPVWRNIVDSFSSAGGNTSMVLKGGAKEAESSIVKNAAHGIDFRINLLNPNFKRPKELLSLADTKKREHRFMLIGGVRGILGLMKKFGANPNIKTFTEVRTEPQSIF